MQQQLMMTMTTTTIVINSIVLQIRKTGLNENLVRTTDDVAVLLMEDHLSLGGIILK
jgi:hypothetical protein